MTKQEQIFEIARKLEVLMDHKSSLDMTDPSNHPAFFAIEQRQDELYAEMNTILFDVDSGYKVEGISYLQKK